MNMKNISFRRHKFFSQINRSSSNFYGSTTFRKFIKENPKNEMSKIDSPFSINYDLNHIHRRLLHSKIKANPKYNKLEIECYSFKKQKKDKKTKEFFLTTNKSNTILKSRNNIKMLKINELDENIDIIKSKNRKYDTIYPISSSSISRDKNIFTIKNSNIHKLKSEIKEKKENEISSGIKLIDIHQQSLLDTKDLLQKFEIQQNHYNRHLFNDLIMNKQILLKLKIKKSQLEGKILNLNRKIDDIKGKSYIAKEYKNFLLCVKYQVISIDKCKSESFDDDFEQNKNSKDESNIDSVKKKLTSKKSRVFAPLMRQNTLSSKINYPNRIKNKLNTLKDGKINKKLIKRASFQERKNSDAQIFESPFEFKYQMKSIENKLIHLIKKKNKIQEDIIQLKILKEKELHSYKKNVNLDSAIKMDEELLINYKENNHDLQKKLNSLLIKQKDKKLYARKSRDSLVKKLKLNLKIIEKMNKICFTSRKVPEKIENSSITSIRF